MGPQFGPATGPDKEGGEGPKLLISDLSPQEVQRVHLLVGEYVHLCAGVENQADWTAFNKRVDGLGVQEKEALMELLASYRDTISRMVDRKPRDFF